MRGFGAGKTVKVRTTLWSDNGRTIDTCDVDRCEGMTLPRLLCDQAPHIIDGAPRACDVPRSGLERERRARTMIAWGACSIHASSRRPMAAIAITRRWPCPRARPDGRGDPTERTAGRGDGVIPGPHGLTVVLLAPALREACCHSGLIGCGVQRVIGRAGG